jgi:hypothetical protein
MKPENEVFYYLLLVVYIHLFVRGDRQLWTKLLSRIPIVPNLLIPFTSNFYLTIKVQLYLTSRYVLF